MQYAQELKYNSSRIDIDLNNIGSEDYKQELNTFSEENDILESDVFRLKVGNNIVKQFTWGQYYAIGTAAYWIDQARQFDKWDGIKIGNNLEEEVVACILAGFRVRAEVGFAAFNELRSKGLIRTTNPPSEKDLEDVLQAQLYISGKPKPIRYPFPKQRSKRIAAALKILNENSPPENIFEMRNWLKEFPGIGPKTASWITRNMFESDSLAIIDIHIFRAGICAGIFPTNWKLPRDYDLFEKSFLALAYLGNVSTTQLDSCIWEQMRSFGKWGISRLYNTHASI